MSVKTGPQPWTFPESTRIKVTAEKDFSILELDDSGEYSRFLARSVDGVCVFRTTREVNAYIAVPEGTHFFISIPIPFYDPSDPIPVEVPEGAIRPETLEEKLRRMLGAMVAERFGKDSKEYDSIDEAMDFEMDEEDADPLSGFEVLDMQEDPDPQDIPPPPEPTPEPGGPDPQLPLESESEVPPK